MCVCFQYDNLKDICKIGKSTVPVLSDSQHVYTQFYIKCSIQSATTKACLMNNIMGVERSITLDKL